MNKSTLSQYGWIIVVSIITAILLALSTPLGDFIGKSFVSVSKNSEEIINSKFDEYDENQAFFTEMLNENENFAQGGLYSVSTDYSGAYKDMKLDWTTLTSKTNVFNGTEVVKIRPISTNNGVLVTRYDGVDNLSKYILDGDLVLRNGVETLGENAFAECNKINSCCLKTVKTIETGAFKNCVMLKYIALNKDTISLISQKAFSGCTNLTKIYYNGTLSEFQDIEIQKQFLSQIVTVICTDGSFDRML